ncbi:hypothetical protein [Streptomyces sp. NPDC053726]|uniref:hypothetical protein n=1 Tax=Streptomyces sp. NPDC053726 TaxID=3365713 RepID=UPI0037D12BCF
MQPVDVVSGALFGAAAAALARAAWQASRCQVYRRTAEWGAVGLVLTGCAVYVRTAFGGPRPAHPFGMTPGAPWWQVAAIAAVVFAAAVAAGGMRLVARGVRALRRFRRRRRVHASNVHVAALYTRHDAIRELYGAALLADVADELADPEHVDQLAAALHQAADLRDAASDNYAAGSRYAQAVGELEEAWQPLASEARRRGIGPYDRHQAESD